jgi:hypothetical protein
MTRNILSFYLPRFHLVIQIEWINNKLGKPAKTQSETKEIRTEGPRLGQLSEGWKRENYDADKRWIKFVNDTP